MPKPPHPRPTYGKNPHIGPSGDLRRETSWLAIAIAAAIVAGILAADVATGTSVILIGLLGSAPLLCGLTANVRATRVVGAAAFAVAALSFLWNENRASGTYWVSLGVVAYGWVFGLLMASLRVRLNKEAVRLRALAELGRVAQGGLPAAETARAMVECLVPAVADLCVIDAVDEDGHLERLAVALAGDPQAAESLLRRPPTASSSDGSSSNAALHAHTRYFPDVDDRFLRTVANDEEDVELLRSLHLQSLILVPLLSDGVPYGVLSLAARAPSPRIDAEGAAFAETAAGRVGLALRNALLSERLRGADARQQAILSSVDAGIIARDPQGRVVFANEGSAHLLRATREELFSEAPRETLERYEVYDDEGRALSLEDLPGPRALRGETEPPPMIVRNIVRATGEERWLLQKAAPVRDERGKVIMVVNLVEDVTQAKRAELAERLLAEAGRRVTEARDLQEVLRAVAEAAVPGLADWAAVDLLEGRRIVGAALAHRDPAMVRLGLRLRERWPPELEEEGGIGLVLRSGRPQLAREVSEEMLRAVARDEEHLELMRAVGLCSAMILPVTAGGRVLGALSLVSSTARRFEERDVELAGDLARLAGIAIEKASYADDQREIARTLQASLLPRRISSPPGWSVSSAYRAAGSVNEVGGDFFDVVRFEGGWAAIVGDVVGKGAAAAAVTGLVRHTLASVLEQTGEPLVALDAVNRRLRSDDGEGLTLCTVALIAAREEGPLLVCCAGHPLPLLLRAGEVSEVGRPGLLLGYREELGLAPEELSVEPGDALLLYTDGATDARGGSGTSFGEQRLKETLAALGPGGGPGLAGAVAERIERFQGARQFDDIALLALVREPRGT